MALLAEELTVWEIGFRWAGLDPDRLWFLIPLPVKDNFKLLMEAILSGEVACETLTLAKLRQGSKADPKFYVRTHIDEVYACIQGKFYSRKLLRWATIDRMEFYDWCAARAIPYPEFWFPPGWKLTFEMPEGGTRALRTRHMEPEEGGLFSVRYDPLFSDSEGGSPSEDDELSNGKSSLRQNQRARVACQEIAARIWRDDPSRTIASVVKDELVQKYGGADHFQNDTVRGWIKEVAPPEVRSRRGRPRKNTDRD